MAARCNDSELEYCQADGFRKILSVKRTLFDNAVSGEKYIVATSRDITDDRLREERLRLLASVFNGTSEGVAIISPTGHICEANLAFLSLSGITTTSPFGMRLSETLVFEDADFDQVVADVVNGMAWAGKARVPGQVRSCWVSLSRSLDREASSNRSIALLSDITELENTQTRLRRQALYDNLTGLPNRRFFREHLQQLIDQSTEPFTVCFLDLDDFKHVNDSAGHSTGDRLLQANLYGRDAGNDGYSTPSA